jgi:hypothetical protein
MATSGGTVKDILPIPDSLTPVTQPNKEETSQSLADQPTMSHALAIADHDEKGHAQEDHDGEVKNLGWNEPEDGIANPLVGRLSNDDLWILIRRFNKVSNPSLFVDSALITFLANVPCEGADECGTWQPRPQHRRRRGVFA